MGTELKTTFHSAVRISRAITSKFNSAVAAAGLARQATSNSNSNLTQEASFIGEEECSEKGTTSAFEAMYRSGTQAAIFIQSYVFEKLKFIYNVVFTWSLQLGVKVGVGWQDDGCMVASLTTGWAAV